LAQTGDFSQEVYFKNQHLFMRILVYMLLFVGASSPLFAQKTYFQQKVDYTIKVALDDNAHTLTGNVSFEYSNNSPDQLSEIWIHLWPNAFKNRRSAYCRQTLRQGSGKFYFADEKDLGSIKGLAFKVDGSEATWRFDKNNPDIAVVTLPKPLPTGGKVVVATPFVVKVPASFSRLGHVETSYQVTQWFPKPAVYDRDGWHAMPYLNQGEFYSEFGDFDVEITVPDNYVVGATGVLQNASEWAFLAQKEKETRAELANFKEPTTKTKRKDRTAEDVFPASSGTTKTLRYLAKNVHDFAWFADKRFYVLRDTARLASGKTVDCWAMFTKSDFKHWQRGAFYVKRAVEFYSKHVGDYPWPHATAVHSALSAGGGMEYPMITVIGDSDSDKSLDNVITHEVGHNWFYGLLASNERDHPWMDEGMNSYYEQRYIRTYYSESVSDGMIPKKMYNPAKYGDLLAMGNLLLARNGEDTPADRNSDHMTNISYGLQSYMKTAQCLRWLENAVGVGKFDAAMKAYYQKWHYKHPQPNDFAQSMVDNGINIQWFMEQMQTRLHADAAIKKVQKDAAGNTTVTVAQRGKNKAPFSVTALKDGQPQATKWFDPANGQKQFDMGQVDANTFVLNHEGLAIDYRSLNNKFAQKSLLKKGEGIDIGLVKPFQHKNRRTLGVLPWVGWNNYDKAQVGLLLYNPPLPGQALQYYLAPGFGIGSGDLVGGGDIRWRIHPTNGPIKRITVGVDGRTFNEDILGPSTNRYDARFYRITPKVQFDFRSTNTAHRHVVALRWNQLGQESGFDTAGVKESYVTSGIWEAKYKFANLSLPNPLDLALVLEGQAWDDAGESNNYLRLGLEWKQQFYYAPKRKVSARAYGGYFIANTHRDRKSIGFDANDFIARGTLSLAQNGYTDYKRDYLYFNRNGDNNFSSRQVQLAEGGFKYAFGGAYAGTGSVGHSNNFLFAINLDADLPKRLPLGIPIKPYFDLGYADLGYLPAGGDEPSQLFWSGGFQLSFLGGYFNVYFPAVNSDNINRLYKETSNGNYLRRITWSIKLDGLEPLNFADRFNK
jgi:hypothetical protein